MTAETLPFWFALFIQLTLGFAVFRANPQNRANQSFLVICAFISAWFVSLHFAFAADKVSRADFWIRAASVCGILIVNG